MARPISPASDQKKGGSVGCTENTQVRCRERKIRSDRKIQLLSKLSPKEFAKKIREWIGTAQRDEHRIHHNTKDERQFDRETPRFDHMQFPPRRRAPVEGSRRAPLVFAACCVGAAAPRAVLSTLHSFRSVRFFPVPSGAQKQAAGGPCKPRRVRGDMKRGQMSGISYRGLSSV